MGLAGLFRKKHKQQPTVPKSDNVAAASTQVPANVSAGAFLATPAAHAAATPEQLAATASSPQAQQSSAAHDSVASAATSLPPLLTHVPHAPLPTPATPPPTLCRLGVIVDPCLDTARPFSLTSTSFDVVLAPDAPLDALYAQVRERLRVVGVDEEDCGGLPAGWSIGCYKVNIPHQAVSHAREYTERYQLPVHLIAHFPSYNLLDESQRQASMTVSGPGTPAAALSMEGRGGGDWGSQAVGGPYESFTSSPSRPISILDWFPDVALETRQALPSSSSHFSILVRLGRTGPDGASPMTLLAHFAKPASPPNPRSLRSPASSSSTAFPSPSGSASATPRSPALSTFNGASRDPPYPPVAFECPRTASIAELKEIVLRADNRPVGALNKLVLWRVDMSWREMLDCEAFGGLTSGDMPWPYPPNCPQPVSMHDNVGQGGKANVSVATVFPGHLSNANLVSVFVWIHPSATGILARRHQSVEPSASNHETASTSIPVFRVPMVFPNPETTPRPSTAIESSNAAWPSSPRLDSRPSFARTHSQRVPGPVSRHQRDLSGASTIVPLAAGHRDLASSPSPSALPASMQPLSSSVGKPRRAKGRPCTAPSRTPAWDPSQSPIIPSTPRFGESRIRVGQDDGQEMHGVELALHRTPRPSSQSRSASPSRSSSATSRPISSSSGSQYHHHPLSPLALESFVASVSPPTSSFLLGVGRDARSGSCSSDVSTAPSGIDLQDPLVDLLSAGQGLGIGLGLSHAGGGGDFGLLTQSNSVHDTRASSSSSFTSSSASSSVSSRESASSTSASLRSSAADTDATSVLSLASLDLQGKRKSEQANLHDALGGLGFTVEGRKGQQQQVCLVGA